MTDGQRPALYISMSLPHSRRDILRKKITRKEAEIRNETNKK